MKYLKKQTQQGGYSVTELLIVVIILSLVVPLAILYYQTFYAKAKVLAALSDMLPQVEQSTYYYQITGEWPSDKERFILDGGRENLPGSGVPYQRVSNENSGGFSLLLSNLSSGENQVTWNPAFSPAQGQHFIVWTCGDHAVKEQMRIHRPMKTTILRKYLPSICR